MEVNMEIQRGDIFIEGIDIIIRRDLEKHKALLEKDIMGIESLQVARSNEIRRKQFYGEQKGKRRYKDNAMNTAIEQMNKNIGHLSMRIKFTEDMKKQNTLIVDTLTEQLKEYDTMLRTIAKRNINGDSN